MDKLIELPDEVVKAAQEATGVADERSAVETAVRGFAASQQTIDPTLKALLELAGTDLIDPSYDYKAMRQSSHGNNH
jgi:Arc/MetJ family transcription regulator